MNIRNILFWNVDTQKDFMNPDGKLYASGAEEIKDNLRIITRLARKKRIRVINTADYHYINSPELDKNPDFKHTFPEHCMAGSEGAEHIKETKPNNPLIFDWDKEYLIYEGMPDLKEHKDFVIRKDAFDAFSGNPYTEAILSLLNPETVFVYGVYTNVCVDYAVVGLAKRVANVYVIRDAIKELPGIEPPYDKWDKLNVKRITTGELVDMFTR
jgi:nicotinamidase/pyrazinamidase